MHKLKNILIFGPVGSVGGVKTHVALLYNLLTSMADKITITRGVPFLSLIYKKMFEPPELVIYNLSIYRNVLIKNILAHFLLITRKIKFIIHLHGGDFDSLHFFQYSVTRFILRQYFKSMDQIYCLTEDQEFFLKKLLPNSNNISRIFNYVELPDYESKLKKNETTNFLYIGRLHPDKGVLLSIKILQQLKQNNWHFWIVGSGELEKEIKTIDDHRITFAGQKFGKDKNEFFIKSHVFLFASSWDEGLPYALLEAAAYGLSIVASDKGAVRQVVEDGVNGIIIDPANKVQFKAQLEGLLDTPDTILSMGKQSRQIAERKFSIEILSELYQNLFRKWFIK